MVDEELIAIATFMRWVGLWLGHAALRKVGAAHDNGCRSSLLHKGLNGLAVLPLHACGRSSMMLHVTKPSQPNMSTTHLNTRVQKHRDALREAGLRPVQIWVPDTRRPDFAQECRRQCSLAARSDASDTETQQLLDDGLADLDGWTS